METVKNKGYVDGSFVTSQSDELVRSATDQSSQQQPIGTRTAEETAELNKLLASQGQNIRRKLGQNFAQKMPQSLPGHITTLKGEQIDLAKLKEECIALTKAQPGTTEAAKFQSCVSQYAAQYLDKYKRGESAAISTDEARIFTPYLNDVDERDISELLLAANPLVREISRLAIPLILKELPEAPLVCLYGPSGVGKSSIKDTLIPGSIRFEGGTACSGEEYKSMLRAAKLDNSQRSISFVGMIASPEVMAERVVSRMLNATRKIDCRYFPQYMLGGYEKARQSFVKLAGLSHEEGVSTSFFDNTTELKEIDPLTLEAIENDQGLAWATATKKLSESESPRAKPYLPVE